MNTAQTNEKIRVINLNFQYLPIQQENTKGGRMEEEFFVFRV
jgi:hypothetical protein